MTNEIVFISNIVGNGGAGRVISILANEFINMGYEVTICSFIEGYEEYEMDSRIKRITLPKNKGSVKTQKLRRIISLRNELKKHENAIVISFEHFVNMQTIIAKAGINCKLIVSERNDPAQQDDRYVFKHLRNALYRYCNTLVCQTPDAKKYFPQNVQKHAVVIANPIKGDLPEPWTGIRKKEIVNFCRLEKQKNLPLLVDAFELLHYDYPEYKLSIYGDGSEKENLQEYIIHKKLQGSIQLYNGTNNVHDYIKDCAMFVSSSDYEGLSNSMLEAMAIGLPTIVTDCPCGGSRMVIEDGVNGILTPVNDKQSLYCAMKRFIESEAESKIISENATKIRETCSYENICKEWIQLF